jgi:pilus assembly protein Flp/PilA
LLSFYRFARHHLLRHPSRTAIDLMESERRSPGRDKGQGLVEYSLLLVLVAMTVVAILTILGPQIGNAFSTITSELSPLPGP